MGLLDAIGFIAIVYFAISFLLWTLLDCDIELYFTEKLGKPISELIRPLEGASSGVESIKPTTGGTFSF